MEKDERPNARALETQLGFVPRPRLEEYREKYVRFFRLERRGSVLIARMHTDGGPAVFNLDLHNAWSQLWLDVGNDPDNEVLILAGTGDAWLIGPELENIEDLSRGGAQMPPDMFFEQGYSDATKLLESFIFNIDIPTIACINGPGLHTEFALLCDITLCAEHAEIFDPHFGWLVAPGDGQGLAMQELMGPKRAAYYIYTSEKISADAAKALGLVNEVLSLERLLPRAEEIATLIMQKPRHVRRLTSALVRRSWKRRLVQDLGFHLAHEMLGLRLSQ
jgi:enoyl-CoA hydratase/carnithine racemase